MTASVPSPLRLTDYERHLSEQIATLREQVRVISTRPLPDLTDPGYVVFQALMEDARERGEVCLQVRETTLLEIAWEPAANADPASSGGAS